MPNDWLRMDVCKDVLVSADLIALLAPRLEQHPTEWKWVVLASQNAVQGAMVCAIHDTTKTNVLSESSTKKMLNWLDKLAGHPPNERLAEFGALLERFRVKYPDVLTEEKYDQIARLHETFRNKFAHFTVTSWSIEIAMLPPLVRSAIDLIEVAMAQPQVLMQTSGNFKRRLANNLRTARDALAASRGAPAQ